FVDSVGTDLENIFYAKDGEPQYTAMGIAILAELTPEKPKFKLSDITDYDSIIPGFTKMAGLELYAKPE
ncbi:MAG: hypothetical protein HQL69_21560, partial [Magnetococcales bacterium]|nr:hypothetical protein [Magnetococcales bacterium]